MQILAQDPEGRVHHNIPQITRSLPQILGLLKHIAKSQQENNMGKNAKEVIAHLMEP